MPPKKKQQKIIIVDAEGNKLDMSGNIIEGEKKLPRYKEIINKKPIKPKHIIYDEDNSSDDNDEFEYEITPVEKPKPIKKVIEKPVVPEVIQPIIQPEIPIPEIPKPEIPVKPTIDFENEIIKLKTENDKLKSGLVFSEHLQRISSLSRNVKVKF